MELPVDLPPLTTRQVADFLGQPRSRLDKWIGLELFTPDAEVQNGQTRKWSLPEVWTLAILLELVDSLGMTVSAATAIVPRALTISRTEDSYFVAWQGEVEGVGGVSTCIPGQWMTDVLSKSELSMFVTRENVHRHLAVNVSRIFAQIVPHWPNGWAARR